VFDLVPADRRRDRGPLACPHRVDRDRRFAAVVLRPVDEDLPCDRPLSFRDDMVRVSFRAAGRSLWPAVSS
jgi:hypothetical protein